MITLLGIFCQGQNEDFWCQNGRFWAFFGLRARFFDSCNHLISFISGNTPGFCPEIRDMKKDEHLENIFIFLGNTAIAAAGALAQAEEVGQEKIDRKASHKGQVHLAFQVGW